MWLLFLGSVIFSRTESAFGKQNGVIGGKNILFNCVKMFSACLVGLVFAISGGIFFHSQTIIYAGIYSVFLIIACFCGLQALSCGRMAFTSMIASFSLIVPCLFGWLFLKETLSTCGIIGFVLVCVSIVLLNYKKKGQTGALSVKCWIYSIITMLANGGASVVQKLHQTEFPNLYRGEFMLYSMAFAFLVFLVIMLFSKSQNNQNQSSQNNENNKTKKKTLFYGAIAGVCNCLANFFILYLSAGENASVLFPTISALNMVFACVIGRIFFKEKINLVQVISIIIGITSVVLLKI